MLERRMLMLVAALVVLLASAALWNAFVRPPAGVSGGAMPQAASAESVVRVSGPALDSMADAVRSAFQRWQEAGVPVRFNLDADSSSAEVRVQWRIQFEGERSGQTDLQWDDDGHLTGGAVTLATFDAKGQPFAPDDVRVLALHEIGHLIGLDHSSDLGLGVHDVARIRRVIGHLIGLDHSPDPADIMYAQPKVRDLPPRDIRTASLL